MAQYTIISSGVPMEIEEGTKGYRYRVHDGLLNLDETLTDQGFTGYVDIDWQNLEVITAGGTFEFRVGVRNARWVIDETLDATGFSGVSGINWTNIEEHTAGAMEIRADSGTVTADSGDITADRI